MPKNEIAVRIFELADKQFSEQRDFAAAIGVTPSIVSQWRNDNTTSFKGRLDVIAQALGTTADYLLTGQKETPATVSGDGQDPNTVRIAGRDGSLFSKRLTDEQLAALKSIIEQMPEADADYL